MKVDRRTQVRKAIMGNIFPLLNIRRCCEMANVSVKKEVIVNKKGLEFIFSNFTVSEHGDIYMNYKLKGQIQDKKNAVLKLKNRLNKEDYIFFPIIEKVKIKGKEFKIQGISIKNENLNELLEIKKEFKIAVEKHEQKLEKELKESKEELELRYKSSVWILINEFSKTNKWKEISKKIEENIDEIRNKLKKYEVKTEAWDGLKITYKISLNDLINIVEEKEEENKEENRKEELIKETRFNERLEEAKKTGEKQVLEQTHEYCIDKYEECTTDLIVKYINPDGKITIERHHTN